MNTNQLVSTLFFYLLTSFFLYANNELDSLNALLVSEKSAIKRIDVLNELSVFFVRKDREKSILYAKEALQLAQENEYARGETRSTFLIGQNDLLNGNKQTALEKFDQALAFTEIYHFEDIEAEIYHNKALAYFFMGMSVESLALYYKAVELNTKLQRHDKLIQNLNNIALVHRDRKDYEKALEYLNRAGTLAKEVKYKDYLGYAEANMGFIFIAMEEYEKAESYLIQSMDIVSDLKDSLRISIAADLLGQAKCGLNRLEEALECTEKAQRMALASNYQDGYINARITQAKILLKQNKFDEAIKLSLATLEEVKTYDSNRYIVNLYDNLTKAYLAKNEIEDAFYYQEQLIVMKDSLFSLEKEKLANQFDLKYLTRQKDLENKLLKAENERDRATIFKQKTYNFLLVSAGVILLLASVILFTSLRTKHADNLKLETAILERTKELQTKNEALINSNAELERLNYVASHDLKQPLVNISSFGALLKRKLPDTVENSRLHEYADIIINGTEKMSFIIENLLEFSRLQNNKELTLEEVDLDELVEQIKASFEYQEAAVKPQINVGKLPLLKTNKALMSILLKNLIENGIKYNTSDQPQINVSYKQSNGQKIISVEDNGIGIAAKHQNEVFEMFRRLHTKEEYDGYGMGLAICQKIALLLGVKIKLTSQPGKGSTFELLIPPT